MTIVGESGPALNGPAGVGRCGVTSLWLALGAFISAVLGIVLLTIVPASVPSQAPSQMWETINDVAVVLYLVAAPLSNLVGAGFGIAALTRSNDRVKFGVIGLLINGGAVVLMIGSVIIAWTTIGYR
jgi:hypothetical protein